jgi:hypothetical protein
VQKQNDCWWFGQTGKCHNFYILMAFVGVSEVIDIACIFLWSMLTNAETGTTANNSGNSEGDSGEVWKRR